MHTPSPPFHTTPKPPPDRWWPSDMLRHRRASFIEIDLGPGVWPTPAFTTDKDPTALHALLVQVRMALLGVVGVVVVVGCVCLVS